MDSLPNEIIGEIFGHIKWPMMPLVGQVCKRWNTIGRQLWANKAPIKAYSSYRGGLLAKLAPSGYYCLYDADSGVTEIIFYREARHEVEISLRTGSNDMILGHEIDMVPPDGPSGGGWDSLRNTLEKVDFLNKEKIKELMPLYTMMLAINLLRGCNLADLWGIVGHLLASRN
jgi:F-box-like